MSVILYEPITKSVTGMDTFIPKGSVWKNIDLGREDEEPMIEGIIFVGFQVKNLGERI